MDTQDNPREILRKLVDLQNLEDRASSLQKEISHIPAEIDSLQKELAASTEQLDAAKKDEANAEKARRSLEGEVESLRQKVSNYKTQLMSVKTNTEYQAMLHEISFVEKQIGEKEDSILEHMLDAESLAEEVADASRACEEKGRSFAEQKEQLEKKAAEDSEELERLGTMRADLVKALPDEYLSRYQRIATARNGQAISYLVGQDCSGCHVRLRPQLIADVKTGKKIIQCENCSRILTSGSNQD